jgi:hypothetical protein
MHTEFFSENLRGRDCVGDFDVDGRITLKYILKEWDLSVWTGFIWLRDQ